ncbi:MAG: DUF3732 domain-containing protein [Acidobacteria bacterium]|nr:DUF3732 domain-containing protein [Acidobacteriota bacterium]
MPQHVVANPFTLFYRTETTEHRETLRTIFPLALGAIDGDYLKAEHELRSLQQRIREKSAQLERRAEAARAWEGEAFSLYSRAKELSLLSQDREPATLAECLVSLRRVAATRELPSYQAGSTKAASAELLRVRQRDRDLDQQLGDHRRQLVRLEELREQMASYSAAIGRQSGRLDSLGWFKDAVAAEASCPLCNSTTQSAGRELAVLREAAGQLAIELRVVQDTPAVLSKEEVAVLEEIVTIEEELAIVRARRAELERSLAEEAGRRQRLEEVFRFIGRLEQAVSNFTQSEADSELSVELRELRAREGQLRRQVDSTAREAREKAALLSISRGIGGFAEDLELERASDLIELRVRQLTLRFQDSTTGRQDYLWEIGSGENWMGYHISSLLSLQSYFTRLPQNPVPSFLIIDQPSQVYFPTGREFDEDPGEARTRLSNDEARLRSVLKLLANFVEARQGSFQIIVLEHAGARVWRGLPGIHLVEEWRGEVDLLIPRDWLV